MEIAGKHSIRLEQASSRWKLSDAQLVADTPTSQVFKTFGREGEAFALKLLKPYGSDEMIGVSALRWYAGDGAVRIEDVSGEDIFMEWLDGETLGDVVRRGDDARATDILMDVVLRLHAPRGPLPSELICLESQCEPLLASDFTFWPAPSRPLGAKLKQLARELLDTQPSQIPLHGDLHHDNVMHSTGGWQVIDAKGLVGDPAYEFSNVFRNPIGAENLVNQPDRSVRLARTFGAHFQLDPQRILEWAVVHAALSTFWNKSAGNQIGGDLAMLSVLEQAWDAVK